jgi:hypothetical protein
MLLGSEITPGPKNSVCRSGDRDKLGPLAVVVGRGLGQESGSGADGRDRPSWALNAGVGRGDRHPRGLGAVSRTGSNGGSVGV